mgnify:CR=1 FL=1
MKALATNLIGRDALGIDGDIGTVADLYFDDERWVVRYLVVETGNWLSQRPVLISRSRSPTSVVKNRPYRSISRSRYSQRAPTSNTCNRYHDNSRSNTPVTSTTRSTGPEEACGEGR